MSTQKATEAVSAVSRGACPSDLSKTKEDTPAHVPDLIASAAHPSLHGIWSYEANARTERRLWVAVLEEQVTLGLEVPHWGDALAAYRHNLDHVDTASIDARERVTKHDVKARIEEFNSMAGYEAIHLSMTSADVVDNVSLIKLRDSLVALGCTHSRPDLIAAAQRIPFRGIKGAIGTMQDQVDLLGSAEAAWELDQRVARRFGFAQVLDNVSQVYPRSIDLHVVSALASACARIKHPLVPVLNGYLAMVAGYQGSTWNEGDVSQSVIRRVALPGAVYAADCILGRREV